MTKKRHFSVYNDFRTGFFCKLSIFLGLTLIALYIIIKAFSFFIKEESSSLLQNIYNFSQSGRCESILAFSLILIAVGVILYFFHCQFGKLAEIAEEIEGNGKIDEEK